MYVYIINVLIIGYPATVTVIESVQMTFLHVTIALRRYRRHIRRQAAALKRSMVNLCCVVGVLTDRGRIKTYMYLSSSFPSLIEHCFEQSEALSQGRCAV